MLLGLSGQHPFRLVSVAFTFSVFLVSVLDVDFFIHQELVVHRFDCFVGGLERVVRYETEAFRYSLVVSGDLRKCTVRVTLGHRVFLRIRDVPWGQQLDFQTC